MNLSGSFLVSVCVQVGVYDFPALHLIARLCNFSVVVVIEICPRMVWNEIYVSRAKMTRSFFLSANPSMR